MNFPVFQVVLEQLKSAEPEIGILAKRTLLSALEIEPIYRYAVKHSEFCKNICEDLATLYTSLPVVNWLKMRKTPAIFKPFQHMLQFVASLLETSSVELRGILVKNLKKEFFDSAVTVSLSQYFYFLEFLIFFKIG